MSLLPASYAVDQEGGGPLRYIFFLRHKKVHLQSRGRRRSQPILLQLSHACKLKFFAFSTPWR